MTGEQVEIEKLRLNLVMIKSMIQRGVHQWSKLIYIFNVEELVDLYKFDFFFIYNLESATLTASQIVIDSMGRMIIFSPCIISLLTI